MKSENQDSLFSSRRRLLRVDGAMLLAPAAAWAGMQREETLADDVASVTRSSIDSTSPVRLAFTDAREGERWLAAMSSRLVRFIPDEDERRRLLINIQYESSRAGPDIQAILGLIEVGNVSRQCAINDVGVRGLMQMMPFWKSYIDSPSHNPFDIRIDLCYGYTILRRYSSIEKSNIVHASARFNDSPGSNKCPNAVLGTWWDKWQWGRATCDSPHAIPLNPV